MTDQDFTKRLSEMDIEWKEHPRGGYWAEVHGVPIQITGSEFMPIMLNFLDGSLPPICEPRPHISQAPAGKAWRWAKQKLDLKEPLGPQTPRDLESEALRKNLEKIFKQAQEQVRKRIRDHGGYEEYIEAKKQKLYMKVIFGDEKPFK